MSASDDEPIPTSTEDSHRKRASNSAGQAGDTQGLSGVAEAGPQSVKELAEDGQALEAEVISGVENAPDPDKKELHTHEAPEDDVPFEYMGRD